MRWNQSDRSDLTHLPFPWHEFLKEPFLRITVDAMKQKSINSFFSKPVPKETVNGTPGMEPAANSKENAKAVKKAEVHTLVLCIPARLRNLYSLTAVFELFASA